jgi:hypothetical protein
VVEISTIEGAFFSTRSAKFGNSEAAKTLEAIPEIRQRKAEPARA